MAKDQRPETDTLQLEDSAMGEFEPLNDGEPEEYVPYEYTEESPRQYEKAEKALNIMTGVLSVLLIIGSVVFWWYFAGRLSKCALIINNYQLYGAMLIACAVATLVTTVVQAVRRTRISPESWMINMCVSGMVTAVAMIIYNVTALGNGLEMNDVLTIVCFSISGCALPAAIFTVIRMLAERLIDGVRFNEAKDRETVYADVLAQCEGRF